MTIEFKNDDKSYIEWLEKNSDGYVLKTKSNRNTTGTLNFHKSICHHISKYTYEEVNGEQVEVISFTRGENIKVCSIDPNKLVRWADNNRLSATEYKICSTCKPHEIKMVISDLLTGWKEA